MSEQKASDKSSKRKVNILPPEEFTGIHRTSVKEKAGGIPAVLNAFSHLSKETGLISGLKKVSKMNQKGGYDCSGCAWPDPDDKRSSLGEYCENGAKALAEEATKKRVTPEFFAKYSVETLSTWSDYELGKSGRITEPMVLEAGESHYQPISWEAAFKRIGESLKGLSSPNEAIFYTSGRTSNEAAFMYQLFVRQFGTNNLPDCSNMCHESSGVGLSETLGIGKGSVTLEDLHIAELIIIMGQNPGTNHPRMLSALKKCKENGGKIVSVNPLPEAGLHKFVDPQSLGSVLKGGTTLADQWLPVRINGDVALLKAIMKIMLEAEEKEPGSVFDKDFIDQQTDGFEDFLAGLKTINLAEAIADAGVPEKQVREVARWVMEKKKIIVCWAMGLTQHQNGVDNIKEVVNLLLLRGAIGKPGAGTCPVRGHSNVQGDRTMGIWEKPKEGFLKALGERFSFHPPREHGFETVGAIHAMREGKAKVFIGMGGNFISATPDSELTGKAMQNCALTVQVSTKLNRSHVVTGDTAIILPCLAKSEEDIQKSGPQMLSCENSMGIVHSSQGPFKPASEHLLSEPAIIAGMAKATLANSSVIWDEMVANYDVIRDHIEAVIPGFDDYNRRVRIPEGFYLPNGAREGKFKTQTGKARFSRIEMPAHDLKEGEYVMMTIRSHDQYNTTIYGLDDRYRGIKHERRVILMNREDMKKDGYKDGDVVDLSSHFGGQTRSVSKFIVIPYDIPPGCTATYFPETNPLVHLDSVARKSHTPASKYVVITISKSS